MISPDEIYKDDTLAAAYEADNVWDQADEFYRARAMEAGPPLLDLGCGTGRFAARLASQGIRAVGVDPADSMLRVARSRPHGDRVTWMLGDARHIRLQDLFNLIMMTGHTFQVFLDRDDRLAALRTMAAHLAPEGRFAFETRNPAVRKWHRWTPLETFRRISTPAHGAVEMWDEAVQDADDDGLIHLTTYFRFVERDETQAGRSILRFTGRDELAALLCEAGLQVEQWLGDWNGSPFDGRQSAEIIVVGRRVAA